LDQKADTEILNRFPRLRTAPQADKDSMTVDPLAKVTPRKAVAAFTPYRLHRGIAPSGLTVKGDRSLVFLKMLSTTSNMIMSEVQALWGYAYLNDKLEINGSKVYWQTALLSRFGKLRYPYGFGARYPEFIFVLSRMWIRCLVIWI
jgi:hypothetical protein